MEGTLCAMWGHNDKISSSRFQKSSVSTVLKNLSASAGVSPFCICYSIPSSYLGSFLVSWFMPLEAKRAKVLIHSVAMNLYAGIFIFIYWGWRLLPSCNCLVVTPHGFGGKRPPEMVCYCLLLHCDSGLPSES